jgi:hypothetical protein
MEVQVTEIRRHHSENGYVDEYDKSLESVKQVRAEQNRRLDYWRAQSEREVA